MPDCFISFSKTAAGVRSDYKLKSVIRRAVVTALSYMEFSYDAELSVTLTDNKYIHKLNKEFRGVDRHTDVLSFPLFEDGDFQDADVMGTVPLGDIVISLERAEEQAAELGNSFLREVAFLAIHSTLHLLGLDHERSPEEDEKQCRLQREIIELLKFEEE